MVRNEKDRPVERRERRKSKDLWSRMVKYISIFAWGLLVAVLWIFHLAQPEFETFFDRYYSLDLKTEWDPKFLVYLTYVVSLGFCSILIGVTIGRSRARRKTDHKVQLFFLLVIYLILVLAARYFP